MNKDNKKNFTSAMGDLKGLLDKEGINIGRPVSSNDTIPTLAADLLDNELINQFEAQQKSSLEDQTDTEQDLENPDLPVLDGTITVTDEQVSPDIDEYIADIDDDDFDVLEFADSVEILEETVESITQPEDLLKFEEQTQRHGDTHKLLQDSQAEVSDPEVETGSITASFNDLSDSIHFEQLKEKLHKQLSFQIELSIAELKAKLLDNLEAELDAAFKNNS